MALHMQAGNAQSQALTVLRQRIEHERERLGCAPGEQLDRLLPDARRKMALAVRQAVQGGDGGDGTVAQARTEAAAADIAAALGQRLNQDVALEVDKTRRALRDIGELLSHQLAVANAGLAAPAAGNPAAAGDALFEKTLKDALGKMPIAELSEKGALAALKFGKEQLPALFKGIGAKTMGRWAGVAGKWAGPVVQVATFLWEIHQAHQEDVAQKRALEREVQAIEDAASEFAGNLRDGYRHLIAALVGQVFVPLEDWLESGQKAAKVQQTGVKADQLLLAQARIALQAVAPV